MIKLRLELLELLKIVRSGTITTVQNTVSTVKNGNQHGRVVGGENDKLNGYGLHMGGNSRVYVVDKM